MDPLRFSALSEQEQEWLDAYLDGTIGAEDFEHLQDRMMEKPELRAVMRRYLSLDHSLRERSGDAGMAISAEVSSWNESEDQPDDGAVAFENLVGDVLHDQGL